MANNLIEVKKSGRGVIMGGVMYIHKLTQAHTHTHTQRAAQKHTQGHSSTLHTDLEGGQRGTSAVYSSRHGEPL